MNAQQASWCVATVCVVLAAAPEARADPVLPPGQETLVLRMLGDRPGGCGRGGVSILRDRIVVELECDGATAAPGAHRVELMHPSSAPPGAVRTSALAIVPEDGAAPLAEALRAQIALHDQELRWVVEGVATPASRRARDAAPRSDAAPRNREPLRGAADPAQRRGAQLSGLVLVAATIAIGLWLWRYRRAAHRGGPT